MGSHIRSSNNQTSSAPQCVSSPTVHDRMRDQLAKDIEAYLAHGGEIKHLDPQMLSNPKDIDTDIESDNY
jgi:hypothetical protein